MNHGTSHVIELKTEAFKAEVIDNGSPILLDFWAPWCGPCRMMKPHLEEAALQLEGIARVAQINIDEEQALAEAFGVQSIPTLVLMHNGQVVDAMRGVVPSDALVARIRSKVIA